MFNWLKKIFKKEEPVPRTKYKKRKRGNTTVYEYMGDDWWPGRWGGEDNWNSSWKGSGTGTWGMTHTLKKGDVSLPKSERQKGVWAIESEHGKEQFYITCPECAAINKITNHRIDVKGDVFPCVVCDKCLKHNFVKLEGWEKTEEHKGTEDWKKWDDTKKNEEMERWRGMAKESGTNDEELNRWLGEMQDRFID